MKDKNNKMTFLDGSQSEQTRAVDNFLSSMTDDEHERAMSDEFAYLDEN